MKNDKKERNDRRVGRIQKKTKNSEILSTYSAIQDISKISDFLEFFLED